MKMSIVENGKTVKEYGITLEEIAPILDSKEQCCYLFFKGCEKNIMITMSVNEFYDLKSATASMEYNIDKYIFRNDKNKLDEGDEIE